MSPFREDAARGIEAASGSPVGHGGDIPFEVLLASFMQTLAVAVDISAARTGQLVTFGKPATGAQG